MIGRAGSFDRRQWRALVATSLRLDWRRAGSGTGLAGGRRRGGAMVAMFVLDVAVGLVLGTLLVWTPDLFLGGLVHFGVVAFSLAAALILDFNTVVLSPVDHAVLAYRPIAPRTFLLARFTTILAYASAIAAALALGPVLLLSMFRADGLAVAGGLAAGTLVLLVAITCGVIGVYTAVVARTRPERLRTVLTIVQLLLSALLYGALVLFPLVSSRGVRSFGLGEPGWWMLLNPLAWFAAWLPWAAGRGSAPITAGVVLSLAATVVLGVASTSRLTLDYASRLTEVASGGTTRPGIGRLLPTFRRGEARAVALLVGAQFRSDMTFRLAVLSIVPLSIVYVLAGIVSSRGEERTFEGLSLLFMAVLSFPVVLYQSLIRSDSWKAAWVFHATPASGRRLILAVRRYLLGVFVVPYLCFVGGLLLMVRFPLHALPLVLVTVFLLSATCLTLVLLVMPRLPFSTPSGPVERTRGIPLLVGGLVGGAFLAARGLESMFAHPAAAAVVVAALVGLNVGLHRALASRVERLLARVEFEA